MKLDGANSPAPQAPQAVDNSYERVREAKEAVLSRLGPDFAPATGIVLGSGLAPLAHNLTSSSKVSYSEIPHMPTPRVIGHDGQLLWGKLAGTPVVCLSGRAHLYEGHSAESVTFGVRLLAALGVETVILTNAAGGIAERCAPGTLMLIEDHLNFTGTSPLVGPNEDRWGPRFPDMSIPYDAELRSLAYLIAAEQRLPLVGGVYAGLLGPSYETPAEIRMLETWGAHAVGMSTVLETIALRHQGARVLGISCITNFAAGKSEQLLHHGEVADVARATSRAFSALITEIVGRLPAAAGAVE